METSTYDWRRVHTSGYRTGDEYIRVSRGQETSTYDRRRIHMSAWRSGDEYIRQEANTYECLEVRRRVHMTGDEYIQVHTSRYQYPKAGDQYIPVCRTGRPVQKVQIK